jgi:leucyl aminopeptidase
MNIKQVKKIENEVNYDSILIPYSKKSNFNFEASETLKEKVKWLTENQEFKENDEKIYERVIMNNEEQLKIIFLKLNEEKINSEKIFSDFSKGFSSCRKLKGKKVLVMLDNVLDQINKYDLYEKAIEAAYLANYDFDKYKTKKAENKLEIVDFYTKIENFDKAVIEAENTSKGTILTRNLVNEPPMRMTPEKLAEEAKKTGANSGFEVTVYDKPEIVKLNMNAFLSVGKGSVNTPKLIVMEYNGSKSSEKLGLVGKGLTYDSGGYSIKPSKSMSTMHSDMAGAAAVIGAMSIIASMELKVNIVAVVAACENRISHEAYLPGDILESMSGKFIEVNNTDAEGRLTLADAVTYIKDKHKVNSIVDLATLTGAIITALGKYRAGSFTNNDDLHEKIEKASNISGEKIWRLPCDEELRQSIESNVADIRNSTQGSTIGGGSITAALFIKEFVEETPWVHIDIAGTSWTDKKLPYSPKGGVGYGARLLYNYAKLMQREN